MASRTYNSTDYRHGFNGKEKDDEMKGSGNSYDFGARIYDSRLGRWLSVDPLMKKYPMLSPYQYCNNSPTLFVDYDGNDFGVFIDEKAGTITIKATFLTASKSQQEQAQRAANALNQISGLYSVVSSDKKSSYRVVFDIQVEMIAKVSEQDGEQPYDISKGSPKELAGSAKYDKMGNSFTVMSRALFYLTNLGETEPLLENGRDVTTMYPNIPESGNPPTEMDELKRQEAIIQQTKADVDGMLQAMGVSGDMQGGWEEKIKAVLTYASEVNQGSKINLKKSPQNNTALSADQANQPAARVEYTNSQGEKGNKEINGSLKKSSEIQKKR